jgi:prepilin signal peptidase PulO-like enzyme (type II secretory pathway)
MAVHLTGGSAVAFLLGVPLTIGVAFALLLRSAVSGAVVAVGVFALFFVAAALPTKRKATKEEVARSIEDFVNGTGGPWDWDDFISCRIADEELEEIRIKCIRTQVEHPSGAIGWCNEEGIEVLRELAKQLRSGG